MNINDERRYLWHAVDCDGEVLEAFVTKRRSKKSGIETSWKTDEAARLARGDRDGPVSSYRAALRDRNPSQLQATRRWLNNHVENSHLPLGRREQAMLRFPRTRSLQMFTAVHSHVYDHFNQERSFSSRDTFKLNRAAAFAA